jgi:hypothetical protein
MLRNVMKMRKTAAWVLGLFLLMAAGQAAAANDDWRNLSPREKDRIRRNYHRWVNLPSQD